VYKSLCLGVCPKISISAEFLHLAPISDSDVFNALKCLWPSKSVGLDDIPDFAIKRCAHNFLPVLKHIFNLSLSHIFLPYEGKRQLLLLLKEQQCLY
jgi:hypothetical protein